MTQPSWTPAKARMLCLAYLEIKKGPGICKSGTWSLIFENFKRRIAQYNERMAIERANRGNADRNNSDFGDDCDDLACTVSADSLRRIFGTVRHSTLQLRKHLPPTPHTSQEAEFQWIADWRESWHKRSRHSRLNIHALVECWRLLKDAPQIADASSPASAQFYPQLTLRPFRLLARKSVAASVRARNRCDHQGSSPHGETDGDHASEDGDNSVRTSGDDQYNPDGDNDDNDDNDDNEFAPATVTSYENTESSSDNDNDSATHMRGSNGQQPATATAYTPSRKRKRRGVSADADRSTLVVFNDDEEGGDADDSAHVKNGDAAGDDNGVARTARNRRRRQHRGRRRDNTDGTPQVRSETAQATRTQSRNSARSTPPKVPQGSEEMDMIREELRLAKLKRNYHDLRLQELNLKLQVAEAKKEMEEAHRNRSA